jgi:DeoR/GlpR family transcriptional regulator of sugar metabolism
MKPELPLARRDLIADRLANGQAVVANELAIEFDVSEDAIRRDLRALAAEGKCRRVYGGALPLSPADRPMAARIGEAREQKTALGQLAASTVAAHELVFLDSGSTNLAMVDFLPEDFELTVATNSIDIAAAVLRRADLKLIMVGGSVDPVVGGSIDATAISAVSDMSINRCFLGACSVSNKGSAYALNPSDAAFKRVLLAASQHVTVLATTDKFVATAPHRVASVDAIDCFIVDSDLPTATYKALTRTGAEVLKAKRLA